MACLVSQSEMSAIHVAAANGSFRALAASLASIFDHALMPCVGSRDWKKRRRRTVDFADGRGWTPLHWAAYSGSPGCVALLLHYGADPARPDVQGNSPAYWSLAGAGSGAALSFCMTLAVYRSAAPVGGRRMPLVPTRPSSRESFLAALATEAVAAGRAVTAALGARAVEYLGLPGVPISEISAGHHHGRGKVTWLRCPTRDLHPDSVVGAHKYLTMSNSFIRTFFWPWEAVGVIYRELELPPATIVTPTASAPASGSESDASDGEGDATSNSGSATSARRASSARRAAAASASAAASEAAKELRTWVATRPRGTDRRSSRRASPGDLAMAAAAVGDSAALARAMDEASGSFMMCDLVASVSLLHVAARHEQPACARLVLDRASSFTEAAGAPDAAGCTPLHWAAAAGSWRCANMLLQAASCGVRSETGATVAEPSDTAATSTRRTSRVNDSHTTGDSVTPSWARDQETGSHGLVSALLALMDCRGWTPLHAAAFHAQPRAAALLLMAGSDPMALDRKGRAPLALASGSGCGTTTQLLLAYSARSGRLNVNGRDARGRTALHEAAAYGCYGAAGLLLAADASATLGDRRKQTQLISALAARSQRTALLISASLTARIKNTRTGSGAISPHAASHGSAAARTPARSFLRGVQRAFVRVSPPRGTTARPLSHAARSAVGPDHTQDGGSAHTDDGHALEGPSARPASPMNLASTAAALPSFDTSSWAVVAPLGPVVSSDRGKPATPSPGTRVGLSTWIDSTLTLVSQLRPDRFSAWSEEALGEYVVANTGPDMAVVYRRQNDDRDWTLAHFAAGAGCLPLLRAIGDAEVSLLYALKPQCLQSVVHDACVNGRLECLKYLLERSAPAGMGDKNGDTPLHWLAFKGFGACARVLIEDGVGIDVNDVNLDNGTPLHSAANNGDAGLGELLIRAGCDPNQLMTDGNGAVHNAAFEGHAEFLSMLLDNGCRVDTTNGDGRIALHEAASNGHKQVMDILIQQISRLPQEMVASLLDFKDAGGDTPLHWAVCNNHAASTKCLIEAGACLDTVNLDGGTPLHAAVMNHSISCLKILLLYRCDPNIRFVATGVGENETPLMVAACEGDPAAVAMLLEFGAVADRTNHSGNTALHMACARGLTRVAEALIEGGAKIGARCRGGRVPLELLGDAQHAAAMSAMVNLGSDAARAAASAWEADAMDAHSSPPRPGLAAASAAGISPTRRRADPEASSGVQAGPVVLLPGLARAVTDPMTSASVAPTPSDWGGFAPFFRDQMYADLRLSSRDGFILPAHRVVLAARCPMLAGMLMGGFREASQRSVELDMTGETLSAVVRHIYGAPAVMPSGLDAAVAVFEAADVYQLPGLRADAEVAAVASVSAEAVPRAYVLAKVRGMLLLEAACLRMASLASVADHMQKVLTAGDDAPLEEVDAVSNLLYGKLRTSSQRQIGMLQHFATAVPQARAAHDPGCTTATLAQRSPEWRARSRRTSLGSPASHF